MSCIMLTFVVLCHFGSRYLQSSGHAFASKIASAHLGPAAEAQNQLFGLPQVITMSRLSTSLQPAAAVGEKAASLGPGLTIGLAPTLWGWPVSG